MEREILISEIVEICFVLRIFNSTNEKEIKHTVEIFLEEAMLIQDLYDNILLNAEYFKISNTKKVTDILTELEKIKLKLEEEKERG